MNPRCFSPHLLMRAGQFIHPLASGSPRLHHDTRDTPLPPSALQLQSEERLCLSCQRRMTEITSIPHLPTLNSMPTVCLPSSKTRVTHSPVDFFFFNAPKGHFEIWEAGLNIYPINSWGVSGGGDTEQITWGPCSGYSLFHSFIQSPTIGWAWVTCQTRRSALGSGTEVSEGNAMWTGSSLWDVPSNRGQDWPSGRQRLMSASYVWW